MRCIWGKGASVGTYHDVYQGAYRVHVGVGRAISRIAIGRGMLATLRAGRKRVATRCIAYFCYFELAPFHALKSSSGCRDTIARDDGLYRLLGHAHGCATCQDQHLEDAACGRHVGYGAQSLLFNRRSNVK